MHGDQVLNSSIRKRIFLSYSIEDKLVASKFLRALEDRKINAWVHSLETNEQESLSDQVSRYLSANDYLILFVSQSWLQTAWSMREVQLDFLDDLSHRGITLLPVLIDESEIPESLADSVFFDLSLNFDLGLEKLIRQIRNIPEIDFKILESRQFELMIGDLLDRLGFHDVHTQHRRGEVDFVVQFPTEDPFGAKETEIWAVEVKFHGRERVNPTSISQLAKYITSHPSVTRGAVITNGQLTSAARSVVDTMRDKQRADIRVVEGTDLKRLLLNHEDIVQRYFSRPIAS